jgi:hypothetical protein
MILFGKQLTRTGLKRRSLAGKDQVLGSFDQMIGLTDLPESVTRSRRYASRRLQRSPQWLFSVPRARTRLMEGPLEGLRNGRLSALTPAITE